MFGNKQQVNIYPYIRRNQQMQIAEFSAHMRAMEVHYKGYPLTRYPLPIRCVEKQLMHSLAADFKTDYTHAMKDNQQNIHDFVEGQQQIILQETQTLGKDPTGKQIDDFKQRLKQQQNKAEAAALEKISQMFEKLEAVGTAHPESQDLIISGSDKLISFFSDLLGKAIDFISDLAQRIYEYVKDAVNKVKSFFKNAYNSVSSFFDLLFMPLRSTSLESGVLLEGIKGDKDFIWNKQNSQNHSTCILLFGRSEKLSISVENDDEVDAWKKVITDKSLLEEGAENLGKEIKLALISSTVVITAITAFSSLVAYALSRGYRVRASMNVNSVEFAFEPA